MKEDKTLKNFLNEFFDFYTLRKVGFFPKDMKRADIQGQAKRICEFFEFKTVYEYRATTVRAHLSYDQGERPLHIKSDGELKEEDFITEFKCIYD